MFTGIITRIGKVSVQKENRLCVMTDPWEKPLVTGESIAINGVCLTLVHVDDQGWHFDVLQETLRCTNLGGLKLGDRVNIERALALGDALGGHMVSGHVEGVGKLLDKVPVGRDVCFRFTCDQTLSDVLVEKGSVAINGVSLTVVDLADGVFSVHVIPTTLRETNLGSMQVGDQVNLEADLIGKYVARFLRKLQPEG